LLEHFVGLADAGSGADENLQLSDASVLTPGGLQERLRGRALIAIEVLFRHQDPGMADVAS
jgi:hypothetical protein